MAGKQFLCIVASRLWRYPVDQHFCRNLSISHCFGHNCIFAFNTEIQDGHQKWQEIDFHEKFPVDSAATL